MKTAKKIMSLALALALCLTLAVPAMAAESTAFENEEIKLTNVIEHITSDKEFGGTAFTCIAPAEVTLIPHEYGVTELIYGKVIGDSITSIAEAADRIYNIAFDGISDPDVLSVTLTEPGLYVVEYDLRPGPDNDELPIEEQLPELGFTRYLVNVLPNTSVYENDNVRITNVIDRGDLDTDYSDVGSSIGGAGSAPGMITRHCTCLAPTTITPGAKFGSNIEWYIAVYPENLPEDGDISDLDWDTYDGYTGKDLTLTEPGVYAVGFGSESTEDMCNFVITVQAGSGAASGGDSIRFTDVKSGDWFYDAVKWAVEKGITNGTGKDTFSPDKTCNNAEILTFLWRACGSPKAGEAGGFTDVAAGTWYADAADWAKSKGMVTGTTLSPETPCTRASAVMFIWQAMGKPEAAKPASFDDVAADADYAAAVAWAVEKGVTNGTGENTFSPDTTCTRGHIVTFLQRAFA